MPYHTIHEIISRDNDAEPNDACSARLEVEDVGTNGTADALRDVW